jgi:hypothetical protein
MMGMNYMVDRCMDAMGPMMGGGMMGNGIILVVLLAIFLLWLVGLAAPGRSSSGASGGLLGRTSSDRSLRAGCFYAPARYSPNLVEEEFWEVHLQDPA